MSNITLGIALSMILLVPLGISHSQSVTQPETNTISSHWLPNKACFRDELNQNDTDYYNCWMDNTGKILTSSVLTGNTTNADYALQSLTRYGLNSSKNYLPEAIISSSDTSSSGKVTNRIAMLQASNQSTTLERLTIGNYYAGEHPLAYIGSDRILINGTIYRSANATVYRTPEGFVKRSLFTVNGDSFYVYVNATLYPGNAYANMSMQVMPLNGSISSSDLLYLQVFSNSGQFDNASLYNANGSYERALAYNNGSSPAQSGTILAYSKQDNVFTEDSVAISFNGSTAPVDDFEHWYQDTAFDSLSWIGIAYDSPDVSAGSISAPIFAKIYPIEHLDYHLLNDTAKYISMDVKNTTVSPPVGFGFIAYGLALASADNPNYQTLAKGYWNYYYSRYSSSNHTTPYARSINTLALAGFVLYGCNNTVEQFARNFLSHTSGGSIEESGWGAAATYRLQGCTGLASDRALYESYIHSFVTSSESFSGVVFDNATRFGRPSGTFQFGEAASGLMLGGVPYNNPVVLALMSAVFQSNVSGTVLNYPYTGDPANTETLPAYALSTYLFQGSMINATGYSITAVRDANLTSIVYSNGTLFLGALGYNGSISISHDGLLHTYQVNGMNILPISTTSTAAPVGISSWLYPIITIGLILAIVGISALALSVRKWNRR